MFIILHMSIGEQNVYSTHVSPLGISNASDALQSACHMWQWSALFACSSRFQARDKAEPRSPPSQSSGVHRHQ